MVDAGSSAELSDGVRGVEVVGQAAGGPDGVVAARTLRPDLS